MHSRALLLIALVACGDNLGGNRPPVVAPLQLSTNEDTTVSGTIDASDPDGDMLTFDLVGPEHGGATLVGNLLTYTPVANFHGTDHFSVKVSDGTDVVSAAVDITIASVNDPPVANPDSFAGEEDTALVIAQSALLANDTDADGDTLTVTGVANALHGTAVITGSDITFTPESNFGGDASFDYSITDGTATSSATVTITIGGVNDPPVAVDDTATTAEDTAVVIAASVLTANDSDPEGQTLTVTAVANATHGTASLAGGNVTFTPDPDFNGDAGFDYTVSDGALTAMAHVTVTVTAVDDAPVANDDQVDGTEDTTQVILGTALTANDTDVDGPSLTVVSVQNASHCTVSVSAGDVTFTPDPEFDGDASFDYTVSDGTLTASAHVVVHVAAVNDPPVAVDDVLDGVEDTPQDIDTATLLANDTDVDGPSLSIVAVGNATNCTVALAGTTITFTPAADFNGNATFEYTVSDGTSTDVGLVTVQVAAVNDPPIAFDDAALGLINTPLLIPAGALLANDIDVDGPMLFVSTVQNPTHGTVSIAGSTITFTPDTDFVGTASFEYIVSDSLASDTGLVTVTIASTAVCGDGVIGVLETCDDGNIVNGDGCSSTCQIEVGFTCTGAPSVCSPICGDGLVRGGEECDDGNLVDGDGCTSTCKKEKCGDGIVNNAGTEECDDGNLDDTDGCTTKCVKGVVCNATAQAGGDRFAVDPATGHCYVSFDDDMTTFSDAEKACVAINGYLATITDANEQAIVASVQNPAQNPWIGASDDANTTDDVFIWVTHEPWSFRHFAAGEPDDDVGLGGNGDCIHLANSDSEWADTNCDITTFVVGRICELELNPCGDGVIEGSEECDDGNNVSGDGCSATCQLEVGCGNGIVDPGEECDDDNILSFDGCSSTCHVEPGASCSATSPSLCSKLVINEIDYDNAGTDNSNGQFEFVEIWNAGTGPADVTDIALVLMNGGGATPAEYFFDGTTGAANIGKRIKLASASVPSNLLPPGGAIVVAPAGLTSTLPAGVFSITVVPASSGFIQNGSPDAIALFDLAAHQIVDGLAYEGPVNGVPILGETGTFNFTEGTSTLTSPADPGSAGAPQSLVRRGPNARDTQDNSSDFTLTTTPSPGLANP